ncbi:MAG: hypothetical protein H5T64_06015 [Chloroflexi bacterium]|nr:hypothetical protein [Chloroflexota bacterium]
MWKRHILVCGFSALLFLSTGFLTHADCPDNRAVNSTFEEGARKTEGEGTSLSSAVANGWYPWAILGDATINREPEFKLEDTDLSPSRYRAHSGRYSQKFFTTFGTHTAGFYQRIPAPAGSTVHFSIWVQIYTGEEELRSGGEFISDLRRPGNYRVYVGIDPCGNTPSGFGAPPPDSVIWSEPVIDRETRRESPDGVIYDAWVQLSVSAPAQSDYITVYTRGQPEFPVKHNDSFWDDACVIIEIPPSPTPRPTNTTLPTEPPTATPLPTETPQPTKTLAPSLTPVPSPLPSTTPAPSPTVIASASVIPTPPLSGEQSASDEIFQWLAIFLLAVATIFLFLAIRPRKH